MRLGLVFTLATALLLPLAARAQSPSDFIQPTTPFAAAISPQYPAPYSDATLSVASSVLDLSAATLSVSIAGSQIYKGSVQPLAIPLGRAGSITEVTVTLSAEDASYEDTLSLQPEDVALVAEPIASAPPLYQGKPSVPLDGNVRIVAIANLRDEGGRMLDPNTLSYAWMVDGTKMANASGIGKSALIVASPLQYRAREVSVAVASPDGSLVGGASLSLSAVDPTIRIYESDPLLGIRFDRALSDSFSIGNAETTLYAAPFSLPTTSGAPLIEWFLNGNSAQTGSTITLHPTGSGQGAASLSAVASRGAYAKAATNLSLIFGTAPSFNFFGL